MSDDSRTCPTCGRELEEWLPDLCPACGEWIPGPGEELPPPGMLTTFGLGMVGLVSGGCIAGAIGLCIISDHDTLGLPILMAAIAGVVTAFVAANLGKHLTRPARLGFERFLLAAVVTSFFGAALAFLGLHNAYVVGGLIAVSTLLLYAHFRRQPADWGREHYRRQSFGGP